MNFQGVKDGPSYDRNYIDESNLTSGKMTPKARRQPTTLGLKQSQEIPDTNSEINDRPPQQQSYLQPPEGAYDDVLRDYPEPLQTEL